MQSSAPPKLVWADGLLDLFSWVTFQSFPLERIEQLSLQKLYCQTFSFACLTMLLIDFLLGSFLGNSLLALTSLVALFIATLCLCLDSALVEASHCASFDVCLIFLDGLLLV